MTLSSCCFVNDNPTVPRHRHDLAFYELFLLAPIDSAGAPLRPIGQARIDLHVHFNSRARMETRGVALSVSFVTWEFHGPGLDSPHSAHCSPPATFSFSQAVAAHGLVRPLLQGQPGSNHDVKNRRREVINRIFDLHDEGTTLRRRSSQVLSFSIVDKEHRPASQIETA